MYSKPPAGTYLLCGTVLLLAGLVSQSGLTTAADGGGTLKVSTILAPPYLSLNDSVEGATGNDKYKGYIRDLLDEISRIAGFQYELQEVTDGKYGAEEGGGWTGMIGEVVKGEAHMAAAPLAITMDREQAVDFTIPFLNYDSMAVMQVRHPEQEPLINSFEDAVNSEEMKVSVAKDSTLAKALQASQFEAPKKAWQELTMEPSLFKKSNNEGVKQARWDDKFVFLIDGATADWILRQEPCNLQGYPTGFYNRKYAIAVPNQSPLRDTINDAIVDLQHDGTMEELYSKWWGEDQCSAASALCWSTPLVTLFSLLILLLSQ